MQLVGLRYLPRVFQRALIGVAIVLALAVVGAAAGWAQDLNAPVHVDTLRAELAQLGVEIRAFRLGVDEFAAKVQALRRTAEEIPVHVFEDDSVALRLFAAPCENDAAKLAVAGSPVQALADKLQKATSNWRVMSPVGIIRVDYAGCWVEFTWRGTQGYAVAFEDGELRFFPAEGFKKTKGQIGT